MASLSLSLVVQLTAEKHCYVTLPHTAFAPHLPVLAHGPAVIQLDWTPQPAQSTTITTTSAPTPVRAYVGWAGALIPPTSPQQSTLLIPSALASTLNLPPATLVRATLLPPPPPQPVAQLTLAPLTADDWEVVGLVGGQVESSMLRQCQVVTVGGVVPFWVEGGGAMVRLRVEGWKGGGGGGGGYVRLGLQTELLVAPMVRDVRGVVGKGETGGKMEKMRKYRLRVQRWEDDVQPTEAREEQKEEEKEEKQQPPPSTTTSAAARCVYVNERTLRSMNLKPHDIIVLTTPSPASPTTAASTTATTSVCRVEVSGRVLPRHVLVPPALVHRHRLRYHQPVVIAALHPQLAVLSTKHVRSLHIQPLYNAPSPSLSPQMLPTASALSSALLAAVHVNKQWPLVVEAEGSVLELQVDGKPQWVQLTVNADNKRPPTTTTTTTTTPAKDTPEQKQTQTEPNHQPKLSVSFSTPLTYFQLCDPQQLPPSVTNSRLPPLPLPLPVVQPAVAAVGVVAAGPVLSSHVLSEIGGMESFISLCLSHLLSFYPNLPTSSSSSSSTPTPTIQSQPPASAGLLLSGSPSSAKSLLATALAHHLYTAHAIHPVHLTPLPRERPEEAVRRCLREAALCAPALLVVDDVDALLPAASGEGGEGVGWEGEASAVGVCELLEAAVAGGGVAVLAVTSSPTAHHARLCSALLFPCVLEMPVLGVEERVDVMEKVMVKRGVTAVGGRETRRRWSERMDGYKGRDVSQVVSRAIHAAISRRTHSAQQQRQREDEDGESLRVSAADFNNALLGFVPVSLSKLAPVTSTLAWDDIGGFHAVKQTLIDTLQLPTQYAPLFNALPLKLRSGLLLYGPPGCGQLHSLHNHCLCHRHRQPPALTHSPCVCIV